MPLQQQFNRHGMTYLLIPFNGYSIEYPLCISWLLIVVGTMLMWRRGEGVATLLLLQSDDSPAPRKNTREVLILSQWTSGQNSVQTFSLWERITHTCEWLSLLVLADTNTLRVVTYIIFIVLHSTYMISTTVPHRWKNWLHPKGMAGGNGVRHTTGVDDGVA